MSPSPHSTFNPLTGILQLSPLSSAAIPSASNFNSRQPSIVRRTRVDGAAIAKEAGDTLRLECLVQGNPPPVVVWYKVSILAASNVRRVACLRSSNNSK